MKITDIICDASTVNFILDEPYFGTVTVKAFSPALKEQVTLGECAVEVAGSTFCIDRYEFRRDGLYLKYVTGLDGFCYVTAAVPKRNRPYPEKSSKKGLQVTMVDDAVELGVKHAAINVSISDMFAKYASDDTFTYSFDGREYNIKKKAVEILDGRVVPLTKADINVTLILLCGKHWNFDIDPELKSALLHPDYDDEGILSAFNMQTDEGVRYYQCFITYLTERYTDPDFEGRAVGLIISNEVQSGWIWSNMGEKTATEYATEYTSALRLACQASEAVCSDVRVYTSFDHNWNKGVDPEKPLRFYGARQLLDEIIALSAKEGDFYWNIAHHPYPEDLSKPDFWNDTKATDGDDTDKITFKNLEVLARYIRQSEHTHRGKARRIILSEQGFNSCMTPESEILQATAYGRAYRIVMEIPEIDSFILHAHKDNLAEFGLNLGIWRRKPDSNELDAPKPIYSVFKMIDKKDHTGKFLWERF